MRRKGTKVADLVATEGQVASLRGKLGAATKRAGDNQEYMLLTAALLEYEKTRAADYRWLLDTATRILQDQQDPRLDLVVDGIKARTTAIELAYAEKIRTRRAEHQALVKQRLAPAVQTNGE
jgi:hypothetical protein